ncbi:MAG: hypothetical protein KGL39_53960 [Patescibacteria group bacterium]|nr:hypothetical protein [Patescibacteria group bacterium]
MSDISNGHQHVEFSQAPICQCDAVVVLLGPHRAPGVLAEVAMARAEGNPSCSSSAADAAGTPV